MNVCKLLRERPTQKIASVASVALCAMKSNSPKSQRPTATYTIDVSITVTAMAMSAMANEARKWKHTCERRRRNRRTEMTTRRFPTKAHTAIRAISIKANTWAHVSNDVLPVLDCPKVGQAGTAAATNGRILAGVARYRNRHFRRACEDAVLAFPSQHRYTQSLLGKDAFKILLSRDRRLFLNGRAIWIHEHADLSTFPPSHSFLSGLHVWRPGRTSRHYFTDKRDDKWKSCIFLLFVSRQINRSHR